MLQSPIWQAIARSVNFRRVYLTRFQNLSSVELIGCSKLTDESLIALGRSPHLEHLVCRRRCIPNLLCPTLTASPPYSVQVFSGSNKVSDASVQAINAPNLTTLAIEKCPKVCCLLFLSGVCPNTHPRPACPASPHQITDAGVVNFLNNAPCASKSVGFSGWRALSTIPAAPRPSPAACPSPLSFPQRTVG